MTRLAKGPHLHYEMRINNKPVNSLTVQVPRKRSIQEELMAEFKDFKNQIGGRLASIMPTAFILAKK